MDQIRKKLTYANVMSTIAVFLVLGGGAAFAASQLAKNSVGTKQLKKNAVTAAKLKNGAVNGAKVADGSLSGADLADGSLSGADLADATIGGGKIANDAIGSAKLADNAVNSAKVLDKSLKGNDLADNSLTGQQIDESTLGQVPDAAKLGGKTGAQFLSSAIYKSESAVEAGTTIGDGTQKIEKSCEPGDVLLSGGPANIAATTTLLESFPSAGVANSWTVRVNKNGQTDNFSVVVLCVDQ